MTDEQLIEHRKKQVRAKIARDPVLRDHIVDMMAFGEWSVDPDGVVECRQDMGAGVVRVMQIERKELRIGREGFDGRQRIPLD